MKTKTVIAVLAWLAAIVIIIAYAVNAVSVPMQAGVWP